MLKVHAIIGSKLMQMFEHDFGGVDRHEVRVMKRREPARNRISVYIMADPVWTSRKDDYVRMLHHR